MANSVVLNKSGVTKSTFRQILDHESKWLYELRKAAWDYFITSPLPERSDHLWRYTDPGLFMLDNPEKFLDPSHDESGRSSNGGLLMSENGSELEEKGVIFESLNSAISNRTGLIREYFGKAIEPEFGKFEAINMSLWNRGIFLYIPDNTVLSEPVHIKYIPSSEFGARRVLMVIGENSEVTIVDEYSANGKLVGLMTNSSAEIFAGRNSRVKYLNLNRLEEHHTLYLTNRNVLESDSNFESIFAGFGAYNSKINIGTILRGRGANSRMTGFIYSDGERSADCHTRHHHMAGDTYSDLDFKVVLKDRAKSAYTGLIRIEKDAPNCEAYQENRNLLLNEGTKAESIPELEILTDQVRCTHGATVGPIDPEILFFLKSRGLSEAKAVRLVIEGFFESTLAKSPELFREILTEELTKRLGEI